MNWASVYLGCALGLGFAACARAERTFAIEDGDRIVFYGDHITDQRLYTTFVETYIVTRFPTMNTSFIHSGWAGERVTGGAGGPIDRRLARDVFAYKPTVVTVMLGMNDAAYRPFQQQSFDAYAKGYRHLVESLKRHLPGARLTLLLPSPYDDVTRKPTFDGGYNRVLMHFGEFAKDLAEKEGATVADLNTPIVAALKKAMETDPARAQALIRDRIHPAPGAHLLMAAALLKAWKAPAVVSSVVVDAAAKRIIQEENTRVDVFKAEDAISWTQLDASLPMAIDLEDQTIATAVAASDVVEVLNQQVLRVTGLDAPSCLLEIDGAKVAEFTKEQLASGVNLARYDTPMMRQALDVHALTLRHNNIHFQRWRTLQVPFENERYASVPKVIEALDALEADIVADQRSRAKPVPHGFELVLLRPSPFEELNRP
jgi:lysophospholipase L1-like esterase